MTDYGGHIQRTFPECTWCVRLTDGDQSETWSAHADTQQFRLFDAMGREIVTWSGDFRQLQSSTVVDLTRTIALSHRSGLEIDYSLKYAAVSREISLTERALDEARAAGTPDDLRIAADLERILPVLRSALETCTDA